MSNLLAGFVGMNTDELNLLQGDDHGSA